MSASAPIVRPWKAFCAATMCGRPVRRAILNAVSFASAPELQNSTRESGASSSPCSRSASCEHRLVDEEVGHVPELRDLARHGVDDGRVRVAQRVHRDAGDQVQVAAAVDVPDLGAAARDELERGVP